MQFSRGGTDWELANEAEPGNEGAALTQSGLFSAGWDQLAHVDGGPSQAARLVINTLSGMKAFLASAGPP
jgi:hypothetical protein